MLLSWFSSNATPRIFVTTALLRSYVYRWRYGPGLYSSGLVLAMRIRVSAALRSSFRNAVNSSGVVGAETTAWVEEFLELWLAEQRDEFAVEPCDDGRRCAARRRQTPPALARKSLQPGLVQGRDIGQQRRACRQANR